MLHVLRLSFLLLALSALTGVTAVSLDSRVNAASISAQAKLGSAQSTPAPLSVRLGSTHARLITAEVEDGPEGEEAPVTTFVRGYDGDDQFQAVSSFIVFTLRFASALDLANWMPPQPSYPALAGFPTGPPAT